MLVEGREGRKFFFGGSEFLNYLGGRMNVFSD